MKPVVSGLRFKDENYYLTNEGYFLGTTCWYVIVEADGHRRYCCADTPWEALRIAADLLEAVALNKFGEWVTQEEERRKIRRDLARG